MKHYTLQFWLVCLSSFLFFGSFNLLIAELPGYLRGLGGGQYVGLIIALFTLTAGISRPFSGKLTDTVGRVPVMVVGSLVCVVCSLLYPLVGTVAAFLVLRLVHGFSTGFKPTGTAAFLADLIPPDRRGEAMGLMGMAGSLGSAAAPAVGSIIAQQWGLNAMFGASAGVALLSVLVMAHMQETLPPAQQHRFHPRLLRVRSDEVLEPTVFGPALVNLLMVVPYGLMVTLVPDLSDQLGLPNRGLFFGVYTAASLLTRFLAGRVSDRYGRVGVLKASAALMVGGMAMVATAYTATQLLAAATVFGIAAGMSSPTVYAWAIDWSYDARRGRAVATLYLAMEAGIGLGAVLGGWIAGSNASRMPLAFGLGAVVAAVAFGTLFLPWRDRRELADDVVADTAPQL